MNPASAISFVIDRHVEDAAFLWLLCDAAIKEPHYRLKDLAELDNRLAAHLDGLSIAGESGWQVATEVLSIDEPGEIFVAAWLAIKTLDGKKLEAVLTLASQSPENYRALVSALAWHSDEHTHGFREAFLRANDAEYFALGINLCALHRIDPENRHRLTTTLR